MTSGVLLRDATAADVGALAGLAVYIGAGGWGEESLRDELGRPTARVRAAVGEGGEVWGFCLAWYVDERAELMTVAVDPAHRRHGIGRALVADVVAEAGRRGCSVVDLEVAAGNLAARRLYEALGFREVARRRRYYHDGSDAVLMRWLGPV